MKKNSRITILDSFRFIAIISVVLFHYYSRWGSKENKISLYPYDNKYDFFSYGYLGVEFFFIISGFVIAYTLYSTDTIQDFWKKRLLRLLPPIVICSLITLIFCVLFDTNNIFPNAHSIKNFVISLTFLNPVLINKFFPSLDVNYLNGSYWSLWPEIQFYFIASVIYFYKPGKFLINFSIVSVLLFLLFWFEGNIHGTNIFRIQERSFYIQQMEFTIKAFTITQYSLWFLMGVLFFKIYTKEYDKYTIATLAIAGILLLKYYSSDWNIRAISLLMIIAFGIFSYYPSLLNWLNNKLMINIGIASYTLYLIHQEIGVLLINKFAGNLGRFDFVLPLIILLILVLFSLASYRFIEKPINIFLKKKVLPKPL
jgi:peptidoglycan/LPS O-acetylase OafA/YrhL